MILSDGFIYKNFPQEGHRVVKMYWNCKKNKYGITVTR